MLEHKSDSISETRGDGGGKLLWRAYRNSRSRTLFRTVPSPTPYGLLLPQDWGSQPPPKTTIAIISGTDEAMNFKFGRNIHSVHPNKSPLKISGKVAVGIVRDSRKFSGHSYIGRISRGHLCDSSACFALMIMMNVGALIPLAQSLVAIRLTSLLVTIETMSDRDCYRLLLTRTCW